MTLIWSCEPADSTVGVSENSPSNGCVPVWALIACWIWSSPTSSEPIAGTGFRPICGMAPCAITPMSSTCRRIAPLATGQTSPPSGSQTMTPSMTPHKPGSHIAGEVLGAEHHSLLVGQRGQDDPAVEPAELDGPAACTIAATPDFMSADPLPRRRPSTTSPL